MAKTPLVKRRKGRPTVEESLAISLEKAILDMKSGITSLLPEAVKTLKTLLTSGTEKVKQQTAIYIIDEAKELHNFYTAEDNDEEGQTGDGIKVVDTSAQMPLTTEIREYKMAENDD